MKKAFTLAEVLITLAIIGVVAAMTIPTLISNYEKKIVVTRLQRFDSIINQAVKLAEVENGEWNTWPGTQQIVRLDSDSLYDWYNMYLAKYIKSQDIKKISDGIIVTLPDGSSFGLYCTSPKPSSFHFYYFVNHKTTKEYIQKNAIYDVNLDGKNSFLFVSNDYGSVAPYLATSDGEVNRDLLINGGETWTSRYGCAKSFKAYCAALIKNDGWQIKDDYPVKF